MPATLPPSQKAAALVLAIGRGRASHLLQHLTSDELDRLAEEIARLGDLDRDARESVYRETLAMAARLRSGGVTASAGSSRRFRRVAEASPEQVARFLSEQHPQVAALVLSHQDPEVGAAVLARLDEPARRDIALRIATMGPTHPDAVAAVEAAVEREIEPPPPDAQATDGAKELASILNRAGKDAEGPILEHLARHDPKLAERVRALMFVFEDITLLDDRSIQEVLKNVETKGLALALKGAAEEVRNVILRNLSERAREALLEEIDLLGPVRRSEVEAARSEIVAQIRALEASGQIVISRGEDGELVE